jgi:hypothetical protein
MNTETGKYFNRYYTIKISITEWTISMQGKKRIAYHINCNDKWHNIVHFWGVILKEVIKKLIENIPIW